MSHSWSTSFMSSGPPTAQKKTEAAAFRDAQLAALHTTATTEDGLIFDAAWTALGVLMGTLDPSGTASWEGNFYCSGAHPGLANVSIGGGLRIQQPDAQPEVLHNWQAQSNARPTAPEQTLIQDAIEANLLVQGETFSAEDQAVFTAATNGILSMFATLDPGATASSISLHLSGQVSEGSLDLVVLNFSLSVVQPSAPGASGPTEILVKKPSDSTSASNSVISDASGMGINIDPSSDYWFTYDIVFSTPALTTGIALGMNGPAGASLIAYTVSIPFAADGQDSHFEGSGTAYNDLVVSSGAPAINTNYVARIFGVVRNGLTAGLLIPRFRSEVNGSMVTVRVGSMGRVTKI